MGRIKLHKPRRVRVKENWEREFLEKVDNFEDKKERNLEKKHLKAYLRGNDRFVSGYTSRMVGTTRVTDPVYSKVKQKLTKIEQ